MSKPVTLTICVRCVTIKHAEHMFITGEASAASETLATHLVLTALYLYTAVSQATGIESTTRTLNTTHGNCIHFSNIRHRLDTT